MREGPRVGVESRASIAVPASETTPATGAAMGSGYAENEEPQPQPPVEFGFLNVKPEPCIDDT